MFVFYDTETTGLNSDFSQILQIALVFTDDNLNILSSKKLQCRRSPWVVPSPGALLTTGFAPDDLKFNKLSHYEMMREVNGWLRGQHWPITFVGYNSIGYDEPVLAQNLHQNLMDPQLTTSKNSANTQSNGVADVIVMVKAVAAYMPDAIKLEIPNGYGGPSMSLINVARQNGVILSDDDAHDAMNDIKATVGVAKFVRKAAPQIWDQMMKLSTAKGLADFLSSHQVFSYTNGKVKGAVMTSLPGTFYNLSVDPAPYLGMTTVQLKEALLTRGAQSPFFMPRRNNQPILMPMELAGANLPAAYDEKVYAARARKIHADKDFLARLEKAALLAEQEQGAQSQVQQGVPAPAPRLPELLIGNEVAFPVRARLDQWMKEFHTAENWHAAAKLIQDFYTRFKDDVEKDPALARFVKFAGRIVYEHAPEELSAEKQEAMKRHIAARVLNPDIHAPYMTVAKARLELQQIERERFIGKNKKWQHATDSEIRALKLYYTSIEKEYAAYAPAPPVNDNAPAPLPPIKKQMDGPAPPKP